MHSPIPDYLLEVLDSCSSDLSGHVADFIPQLATADPDQQALAIATVDGADYSAGEGTHEFTIQSISKPFVYALAVEDIGLEAVLEAVGMEPSGEAFNELSLEGGTGRPLNPMINAGAIATHQLVSYGDRQQIDDGAPQHPSRTEQVRARTAHIVAGLSAFAGRDLQVDYDVADSEYSQAYRNMAIAHMLRTHDVITSDPSEAVRGYIDQCAVLVTVADLAMMAATLANNGINPVTGDQVISPKAARQTLSVMATCGMYDGSGRWLARIGIPAKSGVSGAIIGVLPGQVGIASLSPRLDRVGNSVQGTEMFTRLSVDMGLHLMSNEQPANTAVRGIRTVEGADGADEQVDGGGPAPRERLSRVALQGTLRFTGAERAVRTIVEACDADELEEAVELDLTRVEALSGAGRRMIKEVIRRMRNDGRTVRIEDPEELLRTP